jgi:RHS repeat-associated protein
VVPIHDQDGNMTTGLLNGSGNGQFGFDGANQLIRTQATATSYPTRYTYDAFGRRIAKVTYPNGSAVASDATVFLYDGWNLIAEYKLDSGAWVLDRTYTWGVDLSGNMQGAGGVGGLLSVTKHEAQSTTHFYPIYDGNGNIEAYLDSNGQPAAIYQYDAFGNVLTGNGKGAVIEQAKFSHRFSTKYQDAETGLLYYGYRYYHGIQGRWLNRDPIEENGGLNLYGFLGNGGTDKVDYFGLKVLIYGSIHGSPSLEWNDLSFVGYLDDTEPFARAIASGLQELVGQCATITIEWAGNSLGSYRAKRGKVFKLEYENEKRAPECCSKCWPTIKAMLDSDKKYAVRNFGRSDNAFWSNGPHDTMFNAEGSVYINTSLSFRLPEGSRQGNTSKPPFNEVHPPFSVLLWHELISHGFLGFDHPEIDANGGKILGHTPNGYPIYEGGPGWLREGGSYIDPTIESENEARQCLRDLGSSIGNRRPYYFGPN